MNSLDSQQQLQGKLSWREYQTTLQKKKDARSKIGKTCIFILVIIVATALLFVGFSGYNNFVVLKTKPDIPVPVKNIIEVPKQQIPKLLVKEDVNRLLQNLPSENLEKTNFKITSDNKGYYFTTTIDQILQNFIIAKLKKFKPSDRGKPEKTGIVVMDPSTGSILAMAGMDNTGISTTLCTITSYPAASIFKIVTAVASIEKLNLKAETKLKYNGGKYTLYKRQLIEKNNKYTNKITFRNAFAQSVNPVFGKLGSNKLKRNYLSLYADAFFFNRDINFELSFDPGTIIISKEPYHWAEIACGFNRKTKISPLFGALIAGTIVNGGVMVEPTIIKSVKDKNGIQLYHNKKTVLNRTMKASTAKEIKKMMNATIASGTSRKSFRGYKRDSTLSKLSIGGKTGSIFNTARNIKFDWFVGFAEEKKGSKKLAVAVVVGHGKYIGVRASRYGRMIMKKYFK